MKTINDQKEDVEKTGIKATEIKLRLPHIVRLLLPREVRFERNARDNCLSLIPYKAGGTHVDQRKDHQLGKYVTVLPISYLILLNMQFIFIANAILHCT